MKNLRNLGLACGILLAAAADLPAAPAPAETTAAGKAIAFDPQLGNCLACHQIDDGESPGDIGPPLLAMRARFSSRQALRDQIWDARVNNPDTRMPPFGRYRILSDRQIDQLVDYLLTL